MIVAVIRAICFAIVMLGLLLFLIPMPMGITNVGNVTGAIVCAVFGVYILFSDTINRFFLNRKILLMAVAVLLAVVLTLACVATGFMVTGALRRPTENTTAIVLGCKVNGETPSLMLRERLDAAYKYLTENPNTVCVLSGGKGTEEAISEAECMHRYLTNKGVDASRLYKEELSTSTRENLEFSLEIIREQGLSEELAIITSEFHEYRAAEIARSLGITAYAVPANTEFWLLPTYYVREVYAILYEWVF